ncbi:hypothetical protein MMC16_001652 [Acarospora aff. strigata]|nr:hypothetical protein [Acarospora aff. strigata]
MTAKEPLPVRVLTHNIRYATTSPFKGEEPWDIRRPRLINELRYSTLYSLGAFICLQEVLHTQLTDIERGLNTRRASVRSGSTVPEWAFIGVGRDDGHQAGEYSPIFYQPSIWGLEMFKTIWLSETPEQPSKGWDAASIRILTVGKFRHHESGKTVLALNTHLDDQGSQSRYEGAKIILQEIAKQTEGGVEMRPALVFLAGDLNSEPNQEAYKLLNDASSSVTDLRDLIPQEDRYGHSDTFTGFGHEDERSKRIDFVFLGRSGLVPASDEQTKPEGSWTAQGYSVLENRFDDKVYISDHRAVTGDVRVLWES